MGQRVCSSLCKCCAPPLGCSIWNPSKGNPWSLFSLQVGWSRANLIKKLKENPGGVTLVLKKIPDSVRRRQPHPVSSTQVRDRYSLNSFTSSLRRITGVLYIPCVKLDPAFCYFLYYIKLTQLYSKRFCMDLLLGPWGLVNDSFILSFVNFTFKKTVLSPYQTVCITCFLIQVLQTTGTKH